MPAKFMVQVKRKGLIRVGRFKWAFRDVWRDTAWGSISNAKRRWPQLTYREVMVQW